MTLFETARRRSRIAHFKTPFIVGVASSAATLGCGGKADTLEAGGGSASLATDDTPRPVTIPSASGCDGPVPNIASGCNAPVSCRDGEWVVPAACTPPRPTSVACPSEPPEAGVSCAGLQPGLVCDYPHCYDRVPMIRCGEASGVWEAMDLPTCNPPPIDACPPEMPVAGSECADLGEICGYPGCEGPESSTARCTHGQWLVEYSIGPACNPPAVVPVCPETQPQTDAGCTYDGQVCQYGVCPDVAAPATVLTCSAGIWQQFDVPCVPSSADAGAAQAN